MEIKKYKNAKIRSFMYYLKDNVTYRYLRDVRGRKVFGQGTGKRIKAKSYNYLRAIISIDEI